MKKDRWEYVWISVFQYLFSVLDLKLHSYSCSIMYVSVWENTTKNNETHPCNPIEKSSPWCFCNVIDTIYKYNSQEMVFFPFVIRVQISSWQITICKSIYINCELAIPKILETVSGKNIFYQALNYLFCKFSFLTKICDTSIWQFSQQLRCI